MPSSPTRVARLQGGPHHGHVERVLRAPKYVALAPCGNPACARRLHLQEVLADQAFDGPVYELRRVLVEDAFYEALPDTGALLTALDEAGRALAARA